MMYDATVITRSRAKCLDCGDIIESKHRHDFVRCHCDAIFLDGGLEYIRYGYKDGCSIKLMTETRSKTVAEVMEDINRYQSYPGGWGEMIASAQQYLDTLHDKK